MSRYLKKKSAWKTRSTQFTDNLGVHITGFSEFAEETKKGYSIPTREEGGGKKKKIFNHNFHFDSFQKNRHHPIPPGDPYQGTGAPSSLQCIDLPNKGARVHRSAPAEPRAACEATRGAQLWTAQQDKQHNKFSPHQAGPGRAFFYGMQHASHTTALQQTAGSLQKQLFPRSYLVPLQKVWVPRERWQIIYRYPRSELPSSVYYRCPAW